MELFKNICGTTTIPTLEEIFDDAVKNAAPEASNPLFFEELVAISRRLLFDSSGDYGHVKACIRDYKNWISTIEISPPLKLTALNIVSSFTHLMREDIDKFAERILNVRFNGYKVDNFRYIWIERNTRVKNVQQFLNNLTHVCNALELQKHNVRNKLWVENTRTLFKVFIEMLNDSQELLEFLVFNEKLEGAGMDFCKELYCLTKYFDSMKYAETRFLRAKEEFHTMCHRSHGHCSIDCHNFLIRIMIAVEDYKWKKKSYDEKMTALNRVVDFSSASDDENN